MSLKKTWRKLFVLAIAGFLFFGTSCTLVDAISSSIDTSQTNSGPTYEGVQYDIYLLAVNSGYDGTYEEWLASIRGEDGQSIELRLDEESGWLQWKYTNEDDNSWRNLIEIESLIGPQGPKGDTGSTGTNGITPHIGENGNWWIGDIDTGISATGPQGESGFDGQDGPNGITPHIGENGNWWVGSTDTGVKATGATGQTGEIGATGNGIASIELISTVGNVDTYQITFTNGTTFTYVVTNGIDGTNGITPHIGENGNWWIGDIDTGIDANGIQGETGESGQSAYELYIENYPDYEGDEQQWLDDLINGNLGTKDYFTVTFDSNGGTIVDSQQVEDGRKATRPDEPTRTGYTFDGWYINGDERWVFGGYDVTENITLIAQWTANEYVVTFDAGLGTLTSYTETYTYDSEFTLPTPILEDNYFMGWYLDEQLVESGVWNIDENVTLTAYFIQEKYDVYYDYGYDFIEEVVEASYGQPFTPITPTRADHTFEGWYDSDNNLYTGDAIWNRESDLHLVALWSANDYTITLDLNGGTLEGPTSFAVTYDQAYTLPTPTSSEGPFNGWYLDEVKFTDKFGVSLTNYDQTNDITLKAVFYIEIYTAEDLIAINNDLGASYRLKNDIDLGGVEWIPLGNNLTPFTGIFDGQWYTISGINITTSQTYIGLFGYNEGTLKNIVLDQLTINVTGAIEQNLYGAGLVGYNKGLIDDITNLTGNIYIKPRGGAFAYVGGIVGYQYTSIELSYLHNDFMIEGDLATSVGGLVGYVDSTTTISNSYNSGNVSGSRQVGGLVGYGRTTTTISSSYNSGDVSGSDYVGGLVGNVDSTTISSSYNSGAVSGSNLVGGLVGNGGVTISSSYNCGTVSGSDQVGGLVGYGSNTTISGSYNSGTVSGGAYAGGLVGYGDNTTISSSYNSGAVSGSGAVGGLVGCESTAIYIYYSLNFGDVTANNESIGGVIGSFGYAIANVDQEHVYYTGLLTADGVEVAGMDFGVKVNDLSIFNQDFFVTTLGWDIEMWDFTNLDIANGVYPNLMI